MAISVAERKHRLPHGSQKELATELGWDPADVSRAVAGEIRPKTDESKLKLRRMQEAIAKRLDLSLSEAWSRGELALSEMHERAGV